MSCDVCDEPAVTKIEGVSLCCKHRTEVERLQKEAFENWFRHKRMSKAFEILQEVVGDWNNPTAHDDIEEAKMLLEEAV